MPRTLRTEKKRLTLGVLVGLLTMASAVAFAYWTSTGEAAGTVKANYSSASVTIQVPIQRW